MNSRERVLLACNHKEADRVPIDCGAMRSTGLSAITFSRLNKDLGFHDPALMYDYQQQLAFVGDHIRERFHIDAVDIGEAFIGDIDKDWKPWTLSDGSPCLVPGYLDLRKDENGETGLYDGTGIKVGRMPADAVYPVQCYWPLSGTEEMPEKIDPDCVNHTFWSIPSPPFFLDFVHKKEDKKRFVDTIKAYRKKSDKALMIGIGQSFFECGEFTRKTENWLCDLLQDPEGSERLMNIFEDGYMEKLENMSEIWDDIDIVQFGDDLGTQRNLWMSREDIRKKLLPHYRHLWDYVHSHSKAKVFMHCCGSIFPIIGDFADAGLDIINPVQTSADNMDPVELKKKYGNVITFWGGGCEVQGVLTNGTPEEVRDQVRRRIEIFGKDGGFIFNQVHNVLSNVPLENVYAMYDAAYEYGVY